MFRQSNSTTILVMSSDQRSELVQELLQAGKDRGFDVRFVDSPTEAIELYQGNGHGRKVILAGGEEWQTPRKGRPDGMPYRSVESIYQEMTGKSPLPSGVAVGSWSRANHDYLLERPISLGLAVVGLILTLPIFLIAAAAVWLEDRGSIFFVQERLGKHGRKFKLIKFRSMAEVGDERGVGTDWTSTELPKADAGRLTRVGRVIRRLRIDELPQLMNVIKGDLNAVGPRAETPEAFEIRRRLIPGYDLRLLVQPGMAGWGMMHSYKTAQEKLQYDLYYVRHRSLLFDLWIIFETARRIVFRKV